MRSPQSIKAYFLRQGFKAYLGEIANTLVDKQRYVGGYIEVISVDGVIDLICNETGKLLHLPVNRALVDDDGEVLDVIVGDILIVRHHDGNFVDVHENDLQIIRKYLRPCFALKDDDNCTAIALLSEKDLKDWKDE